jgi:hypothetical protein
MVKAYDTDEEGVQSVIKAAEHLYGKSFKLLSGHLEDFEVFRGEVCQQLAVIGHEIGKLRSMFSVFESTQKHKIKSNVIFAEEEMNEILDKLLRINSAKILKSVEDGIARTKEQITYH